MAEQEVESAVDENFCFSRAGTSNDEERTFCVLDSSFLAWIRIKATFFEHLSLLHFTHRLALITIKIEKENEKLTVFQILSQ